MLRDSDGVWARDVNEAEMDMVATNPAETSMFVTSSTGFSSTSIEELVVIATRIAAGDRGSVVFYCSELERMKNYDTDVVESLFGANPAAVTLLKHINAIL
jgi:ABC-type proline/glycine betaine transport system ATPase subunit